jgi:putative hydrolase of the HAD superfamily
MLYWIFDLDYTLYDLNKSINFNYNKLKKDEKLDKYLKLLPCKKILFTNGTYEHAIKSLNTIDIKGNFREIIARNTIGDLKPNLNSYIKMMFMCDINKKDKCVFFEDSLSNLIVAKKLGWITVLISKFSVNHNSVDFCFPTIHHALLYFLNKIIN